MIKSSLDLQRGYRRGYTKCLKALYLYITKSYMSEEKKIKNRINWLKKELEKHRIVLQNSIQEYNELTGAGKELFRHHIRQFENISNEIELLEKSL